MRKLKFVSGGKEVQLGVPDLKRSSLDRNSLYRFLSGLGYLGFLVYIVSIPVIFFITKGAPEATLVQMTVYLALFLLFVALGKVVLAGSKILVDTPLLMTVLLFALLTVGAYLMSSTNIRNTFGLPAVKYLAGSVIMSSLAIYYFGILFTNTKRKLTVLKYVVLLVPIALAVIYLSNLLISVSSVRIVSSFIPVYLLGLIYLKDMKLRIISLVGLVLAVIINLQYGFTTYISIGVVVEFLSIIAVLAFVERRNLISKLGESLRSIKPFLMDKSQRQISTVSSFWLIALATLIYGSLTAVWIMQNYQFVVDFLNTIALNFSNAMASLHGVVPMLIGTGANLPLKATSYATELQFQGIIGLGGHLLLALSVIYLAARSFYKYLKDRTDQSELFILFPVFVGLAIAATLSLLTQLESTIWWVCLAVLGAEIIINQRTFVKDLLQRLQLKAFIVERRVAMVQVLLIVILVLVFIYLGTLLNQQIIRGLL